MGGADGVPAAQRARPNQSEEARLTTLPERPSESLEAAADPKQVDASASPNAENDTEEGSPPLALGERTQRIGRFSLLNKVTGKVRPVELRLDEPLFVDDLSIVMFDCVSTPPEDPPETKAFLRIVETRKEVEALVFSGWMFASSPSLNALEHPEYDLWPKSCVAADGLVFTGETRP
jgi:hypothetical protein